MYGQNPPRSWWISAWESALIVVSEHESISRGLAICHIGLFEDISTGWSESYQHCPNVMFFFLIFGRWSAFISPSFLPFTLLHPGHPTRFPWSKSPGDDRRRRRKSAVEGPFRSFLGVTAGDVARTVPHSILNGKVVSDSHIQWPLIACFFYGHTFFLQTDPETTSFDDLILPPFRMFFLEFGKIGFVWKWTMPKHSNPLMIIFHHFPY